MEAETVTERETGMETGTETGRETAMETGVGMEAGTEMAMGMEAGMAMGMAMEEAVRAGHPMFEVARSNYSGVFGTGSVEANPGAGNGAFFRNSRISFAHMRDGLSNTLLVGERSSRLGYSTWVGAVPGAYRGMARIVGTASGVPNHVLNDFAAFGSHHPFGANFAMGDGSVRLIGDEIELSVYQALATRSGGERISSGPE